jgi:hypothetical protein
MILLVEKRREQNSLPSPVPFEEGECRKRFKDSAASATSGEGPQRLGHRGGWFFSLSTLLYPLNVEPHLYIIYSKN